MFPIERDTVYPNKQYLKHEKSNIDIKLPSPHINQAKVLKSKARYRVVAAGRRFGKSALSIISSVLRLFKGQRIWHCSPTNQNAKRVFREFIRIFKGISEDLVVINKTDMRIELVFNGAFIEFKSLAEPENLRGEGLDFVVVDEAAFCQDNIWDEILSPMLLGTTGDFSKKGDALFISSTNGRNWFWRMYQLGLDPHEPDYECFTFTSYDNPLIDPKDIDELKRKTPSYIFDREYMAVFEESGGTVFKQIGRVIRDFSISGSVKVGGIKNGVEVIYEPKTEEEFKQLFLDKAVNGQATIVFGVDWAQKNDFTVITVFDIDTKTLITYERFNKLLWEDIEKRIHDLYKIWNPVLIMAEQNNSQAIIEQLQKDGLPVESIYTSSKSKPELINKLALAIEQKDISLPNDKMLISELSSYELNQTKMGNITYSAPSGMHDDVIMSLAFSFYCTETVYSPAAYEIIKV